MDLIKMARDMGHAIQKEDFYLDLMTAKNNADADEELQKLISEFNMKRIAINNEASKEDRDDEALRKLNEEMRSLYSDVMRNEHMTAYNNAKQEFDRVLQRVIAIITQSAEGEDPDTTDYSDNCAHDCSTCGGCG